MYRVGKEVFFFWAPPISIPTQSTLCIQPPRPLTVLRIFIEDIIVLTKCCRIFLVVLGVVVRRGEGGGARPVAKLIFPARNSITISQQHLFMV
jgi:hypothetical protein